MNRKEIHVTVNYIKDILKLKQNQYNTSIGIVLGSGLGFLVDYLHKFYSLKKIKYSVIPNFVISSVDGHDGILVYFTINSVSIFILQGRLHCYEGYSVKQVVFPIRILIALGVKTLLLTNAAGAVNHNLNIGDLMVITDHVNLTNNNPLVGLKTNDFGTCFVDMSYAYNGILIEQLKCISNQYNIFLKNGVYGAVLGPSYETPAEINFIRNCGIDAIGMSTVYETIVARQQKVFVLGISCITNKAAGCNNDIISHNDIKNIKYKIRDNFNILIYNLIKTLV